MRVTRCTHRLPHHPSGHGGRVFFLFSNRLGCLGSLLLSAVLTLVLLLVLDVLLAAVRTCWSAG